MKRICKELEVNDKTTSPSMIIAIISKCKEREEGPEDFLRNGSGLPYEKKIYEVYRRYTDELMAANAMDFDDLLWNGVKLLEQNPDCKIVAAEPKNVSALLGQEPGLHQIQGIGDGFIPDILDTSIITDIVEVSDEDAINTARELARVQGLLVGTSSGANVWAAKQMAKKYGKDKVIATILADRAERYFSTALI